MLYLVLGFGPRFAFHSVRFALSSRRFARSSVGFGPWAPGCAVRCPRLLVLYLYMFARGALEFKVHLQFAARPLLTECAPVALVLERTRVVVGGKKKHRLHSSPFVWRARARRRWGS